MTKINFAQTLKNLDGTDYGTPPLKMGSTIADLMVKQTSDKPAFAMDLALRVNKDAPTEINAEELLFLREAVKKAGFMDLFAHQYNKLLEEKK